MRDRRSSPDFDLQRSLSDLYPTALDSDPKELSKQVGELLTQHARAHDRNVKHAIAFNGRLVGLEHSMVEFEDTVVKDLKDLKTVVESGFADVKLKRAIEETRVKTFVAVILAVWSVLSAVGAAAYTYATKPKCSTGEALIGERCVPVNVTLKN